MCKLGLLGLPARAYVPRPRKTGTRKTPPNPPLAQKCALGKDFTHAGSSMNYVALWVLRVPWRGLFIKAWLGGFIKVPLLVLIHLVVDILLVPGIGGVSLIGLTLTFWAVARRSSTSGLKVA